MPSVDFAFQLSIIWYFARSIDICKVQALTSLRDDLGLCLSDSGKPYLIKWVFFPCLKVENFFSEVHQNLNMTGQYYFFLNLFSSNQ